MRRVASSLAARGIGKGDVLPFYHIYGLTVILSLSLANGATVVTMPRFDLLQFLQVLQDYRVTVGNMVPPIMLALAKQSVVENFNLSHLRVILSAAASLGKELQEACAARLNCPVVQAWGLTETSPDVTFHPLSPEAIKRRFFSTAVHRNVERALQIRATPSLLFNAIVDSI